MERPAADAATPKVPPLQRVESNGYLFELKSCSRSGGDVSCTLMVTNKSEDRYLNLATRTFSSGSSRLIDELGNEHPASELRLGSNASERGVSVILASGIPTKASLNFTGVSVEVRRIALLEIASQTDTRISRGVYFTVQFRDIPLGQ
jgi:hypothetical protein